MSSLLGRQDELAEIGRFLDAIEGGRSRLLLLSGQAGIGKTTLWEAGIRAAQERGVRVVTSRPTEVETGLAFAALGDLVRPLLDPPPPDLPAPQREALDAALLRASAASPPQPLGVALAVLHVLRRAATERPLILAIDDVPWLDDPSVRALEFAVRRLDDDRVGLLLARRTAATDDPLPTWLASVPTDRLARRHVGALSIDAIDGLLRSRLGLDVSRPVVTRLHRISGGTPFYALELGRELQARGVPATMAALTVPRSLDDLIGARFATLDAAAADVALHAAALSQPTRAILDAAIGADRVASGLRGCLDAAVLEVDDARIRFTHPLLATAAYGRATLDERRRVHERLADVVAEAEERARHLARAGVEPNEAVASAIEAGGIVAARRGAPDAAADLLEEAARLTPADADHERVRRRAAAAEHLIVAGDIRRADERYGAVAAALPDGPVRAGILARRGYLALVLGDIDDAQALLREAMPMTAPDDRRRVEIHSLLAGVGFLSWRDWRQARFDAFRALELAHEIGDRGLELQMLGHAATWLHALGRPWRHLVERADALDVPIAEMPTLEHADLQFARILTVEGRIDEARRRLQPLIEKARSNGDWMSLPRFLAVLADTEFQAGDWVRSEAIAAEAQTGLRQTGEGGFLHNVMGTRLALSAGGGDVATARGLAVELESLAAAASFRWSQDFVPVALAALDLSLGEAAAAHERLAPIMSEPGLGRLTPVHWESIVAMEVEALVSLGQLDAARRVVEPVERRAGRRGIPAALAEIRRVRALVLAADSSHGEAIEAAEEAVRLHAGLQVPFRTARAWFTLGEVLRRARQRSASRAAFQTALELFERLGARVWVDRSRSELGRVATRRPSGAALTDTERQVAELAASGRTNREIAAELFMSVHTVEAHLTRIFRALGVQNRTELSRVHLHTATGAEPTEAPTSGR